MKRREFVTGLGSAVASPLAAHAQQPERMRRIGLLMSTAESDSESLPRVNAFLGGLRELGWAQERNLSIDVRWAAADPERTGAHPRELINSAPDLILAVSSMAVAALKQRTQTVPIIFVLVGDPVRNGFVTNVAYPGGNITGFTNAAEPLGGKWLELLKEIAPRADRVLVIYDPANVTGAGYLRAIEAGAQSLGVSVEAGEVRNSDEIVRAIDVFANKANGVVLVVPAPLTAIHRELLVTSSAMHHLPAIYPFRFFVAAGGLMSFGNDVADQFRRAGTYADRILRGMKPGELPVQAVDKFELVINLKTAKSLGLTVPPTLLARADELIE